MRVIKNLKNLIIVGLIAFPVYTFAYTSDADINNTVINKISSDKSLDGVVISVKTAKGVVSLSGNVESDTQAAAATELAQSTSDVKDVNTDELVIKGSQHVIADTIITAKIRGLFIQKKLFGDTDISALSINIETNNGKVSLSGTASSKQEIDNAIRIAKSVSGVDSVVSSVAIKLK